MNFFFFFCKNIIILQEKVNTLAHGNVYLSDCGNLGEFWIFWFVDFLGGKLSICWWLMQKWRCSFCCVKRQKLVMYGSILIETNLKCGQKWFLCSTHMIFFIFLVILDLFIWSPKGWKVMWIMWWYKVYGVLSNIFHSHHNIIMWMEL
jgi:hypothetical protein